MSNIIALKKPFRSCFATSKVLVLIVLGLTVAVRLPAVVSVVPLYSEDPNDGFNSTTITNHPIHGTIELGQMRKKVLTAAASYVGSLFDSAYAGEQIRVTVKMQAMSAGTLGSGGAASYTNGFASVNPKYNAAVNYPAALANHVAASNMIAGPLAEVTLSLTYATWDYGINQSPTGGNESFYTTLVHEIIHGMGFVDSNDGTGGYNPSPSPFDAFVVLDATQRTPFIGMSTQARQAATTSGNVFFNGPLTMAWNPLNPGQPAKLNAPSPYSSSSSIAHYDPATWNPFGLLLLPSASPSVPEKLYLIAMERGTLYDMGYTPGRPALNVAITNGVRYVKFDAIIGAHYALRTSSNLKTWTAISTNQATSASLTITDDSAGSAHFYSVEVVPDILSAIRPSGNQPASFGPYATEHWIR